MSHSKPSATVSVIIGAFNAGAFLAETLDSILSQDIDGLEVIVVDDGSTDDTRAVAARYLPGIRYAWQANSGGCASPRNHGARLARGRFLKFFDSDDVMPPGTLRALVDFMESNPELGMVLTDYRNFSEAGPWDQTHFATCSDLLGHLGVAVPFAAASIGPPEATRVLAKENFAITGTPLWRADAFRKMVGFDETLHASEDFDICYRYARNQTIGIIGQVGMLRRLHAGNLSGRVDRVLQYRIASRKKLAGLETDPLSAARLREFVAGGYVEHADLLATRGDLEAFSALAHSLAIRPRPTLRFVSICAKAILRRTYRTLPLRRRSEHRPF